MEISLKPLPPPFISPFTPKHSSPFSALHDPSNDILTFSNKKNVRSLNANNTMESMCSKMSESMFLSTDTLDSSAQGDPLLNSEQFSRLMFLGQGKFGKVYLVKHKVTGFICAMKVIQKAIVRQQKVQDQIAKQLRIHNQLKSLNVIDFYGFFDDELSVYILLEYATESSVFSKLKGKTRFEQFQVAPIAKGLCQGLRHIHRMGYIHRDIKPENIVLQFGVPKICDFGWATECDDFRLCKSYCGTPLYIAPEMIRKQQYGSSVDMWTVGLVVYELIVGRVPFSIWSQSDMDQILTKSLQFPEYVDKSFECQNFIRRCLEKQSFLRMGISEAQGHQFLKGKDEKKEIDFEFYQDANKVVNNVYY